MKYNRNKRIFMSLYAVTASMLLLTGFSSLTTGSDTGQPAEEVKVQEDTAQWNLPSISGIQDKALEETKSAAEQAHTAYVRKVEEERRAEEEARRQAEEKAAAEKAAAEKAAAEQAAAEQAAAEAAAAQEAVQQTAGTGANEYEKQLLASLIFCEAGNQPYEGQVAVGAVVMNRVKSGVYPNNIAEVIYQSGQFTPAMTGWLDSVLSSSGYTSSAMQAAEDALAGSNPVGDCLYFSTGGYGMQIGDHYFH